ncbi:MAG: nucleoside monophosphate kinase [Candidatus Saccharimonadales bacterium]
MILLFGPAGAGKSVQGHMLAERLDWKWLSTGEMFRSSTDPEVKEILKTGALVSDEKTYTVVEEAFDKAKDFKRLIVDGFPRTHAQAEWLMGNHNTYGRQVEIVIVLEVPDSEILERLTQRGREQDTPEIVAERLDLYRRETDPIIGFFADRGIKIVQINGIGSVEDIHEKIVAEIQKNNLV